MKASYLVAPLAAAALAVSSTAYAQTVRIGSEAAFGAPDGLLDWATLGPAFTPLGNSFVVAATGIPGLTATVSEPYATLERRDSGSGWNGNFARGDALLWNHGGGTVFFSFDRPIHAFGTQFQQNGYGVFTAYVDAYDASGALLGSFWEGGFSDAGEDDTAIFLGVGSTSGISRVAVTTSSGDFTINAARLDAGTAAPEPATLTLVGAGLGVLGLLRRRRGR